MIQCWISNRGLEAKVRGTFRDQGSLFSYLSPATRVPADHPLRQVRALVRDVLKELSQTFGKLYSSEGRFSILPEQLALRLVAAGPLRDSFGAAVDGAIEL
jgi:hypothetical protein